MRYYFDFSDHAGPQLDAEGAAFATFDEMRHQAKRTLTRIAEEAPGAGDNMELRLRVRDDQSTEVYNLCLTLKGTNGQR